MDEANQQSSGPVQRIVSWQQRGYAVVSLVASVPMLHSFHTPEWEAKRAAEEAARLPEQLRNELQVVPATLTFDLTANAAFSGAGTTAQPQQDGLSPASAATHS